MTTTQIPIFDTREGGQAVSVVPVALVAAPADDMQLGLRPARGVAIPAGQPARPAEFDRMVLLVENTGGSPLTVTVTAGDLPVKAGQSDRVYTVVAGATAVLPPLDTSRHRRQDGSVRLTSSEATGTIAAVTAGGRW